MKLKIALGQLDVKLAEPAANLEKARAFAAEAARVNADILVLPELWTTGYDLANAARYATDVTAGLFAEMAGIAREYQIYLLGSSLSLPENGGFGNTAVFLTPTGDLLAQYTKLHLFRLMDEDQYLVPGNQPTLVSTPWGKAGLAICYDLRFPELFRHYALSGASFIFLPAEWPHPRLSHWQTLLRARAIENQVYMIACNRVGTSGDTRFFGHSCVIDPWGELVVEAGETELLLTAEIDLDLVSQVRHKIPVFADRRSDIYGDK